MATFLLTGCAGAGKSTLARAVAALGVQVVHADGAVGLGGWTGRDGTAVPNPAVATAEFFGAHEWDWQREALEELVAGAGREPLLLEGCAANQDSFDDLFAGRFVLLVDGPLQQARLRDPAREHSFGSQPQLEQMLLADRDASQQRWLARGAVPLDGQPGPAALARQLVELLRA